LRSLCPLFVATRSSSRANATSVLRAYKKVRVCTRLPPLKPSENHPYTIQADGVKAMAAEIHRLRDRAGETEKITINLGYVDLGHIDLLVQEGFYSNRTDFIRTAIRNQLATHGEEVRKSIVRHTLELGLRHYTRRDLEAVKAAGEKLQIK